MNNEIETSWLLKMWILAVSLLLASARHVAAIYEDQAGTYDWHRPHVGVAAHLHITHKRHIFIVSQDATLARIAPDDGVLAWRRVQDAPDTPATLRVARVLPKEDGLLTVHTTSDATLLRVWRDGGQLMWEAPLHVEGGGPADVTIAVDDAKGASVVVVLRGSHIAVRVWVLCTYTVKQLGVRCGGFMLCTLCPLSGTHAEWQAPMAV